MNRYYESYATLSTATIRAMLLYEGHVEGRDPARYAAMRDLLAHPRYRNFRVSRGTYVEKPL